MSIATQPTLRATEVSSSWYGWQIIAFDAAVAAMGATEAAIDPDSQTLGAVAVGTYLLGGPAVHVYHQSIDKAVMSLGLRAAAPFALGLMGAAIASGSDDDRGFAKMGTGLGGFAIGAGIGALGASIVDATIFAHEPAPEPNAGTVGGMRSWTPTVSVLPHGAALGLRGTL
jgi:hypothetical protein